MGKDTARARNEVPVLVLGRQVVIKLKARRRCQPSIYAHIHVFIVLLAVFKGVESKKVIVGL